MRSIFLVFGMLPGCCIFSVPHLHAQTPARDVYDGFETAHLSNLWSTDLFAPGAVTMQSQIVRAGHGAAQITLHTGEIFEAGRNGNKDSERAELLEDQQFYVKDDAPFEYAFSEFLPANFPIVPTRLVLAQWKQLCIHPACDDESPVVAIRYVSGVLRITQDLRHHRTILHEEKADLRNRWLDFRFRIRFSTMTTGRIQAWLGDKQLVKFQGITANPEDTASGYPSPSRFYFKMGLYRDVMREPMTIYVDEYHKRELRDGEF